MARFVTLLFLCSLMFIVEGMGQNTWVKYFGRGSYNSPISYLPLSIKSTSDGGCVITGTYQDEFEGDTVKNWRWVDTIIGRNRRDYGDIFVVKYDSVGNIEWRTLFGMTDTIVDRSNSLELTKKEDYLITGTLGGNGGQIFVSKIDKSGNILLKEIVNINNSFKEYIFGYGGYETPNNGYILLCSYNNIINNRYGRYYGVIRTDSLLNIIWKKEFEFPSWYSEIFQSMETVDSCVVFNINNRLIKIDYNGNVVWELIVPTVNIKSISKSNDGQILVIGEDDIGVDLIKIRLSGDIIWKNNYLNQPGNLLKVIGITSKPNNGYLMVGYLNSSLVLIHTDSNGHYQTMKYTNISEGYRKSGNIESNSRNQFFVTGYNTSVSYSTNLFVMKLDSNGNLNNVNSVNEFSEPTTTLSVHPNPFSNTTTISYKVKTPSNISIELLNTLGQTIEVLRNDYSDSGTYQLPLNFSNLTSGMYSVRMRSGSSSIVVPVWVVK